MRAGESGLVSCSWHDEATSVASPSSPMHFARVVLVSLLTCALACGCGGSDEHLAEDGGKVSYYSTLSFRSARLLAVLSFGGGLTYGFYQSDFSTAPMPSLAYEGFFVARPIAGDGGTELQGVEFNFDALTETPIQLSTAGTDDSTFRAVLTDSASGRSETIFAGSASTSSLPTDQSTLAGAYSVEARSAVGSATGTANLSAAGVLDAELSPTCTVEATLSPRLLGNAYDITAHLSDTCPLGGGEYTGHGLQSYGTKIVYVLITKPSGGGVMLLLAPA